jgi:hypothetical protein
LYLGDKDEIKLFLVVMLFLWVLVPYRLDLEEHTVSIFRNKVAMLGSGEIYIGLEEGKAEGVGQSAIRNKE